MVDTPISKQSAAASITGSELVLVSKLSATVTISAATISALASDNSFNDSGSGFIAAGFAVNDYVNVTGFTGNAANNIFSAKITALTTGKMTIGGTDGDVIVDDAAGESVTITKWESKRISTSDLSTGIFSGAMVHKSADETGTNYSAGAVVDWNTEDYDTDAYHPIAATVTITIATPGVVTWTGHNFVAGSPIVLTTTGALPTGLTAGTTYYVVNPASNTFQLSATRGGSAINTTGSQSGVHTATNYSRLTAPANGKYQAAFGVTVANHASSEYIRGAIMKNGSLTWVGRGGQFSLGNISTPFIEGVTPPVDLVAGDYLEAWFDTQSDTSIDITANVSYFAMWRVG